MAWGEPGRQPTNPLAGLKVKSNVQVVLKKAEDDMPAWTI